MTNRGQWFAVGSVLVILAGLVGAGLALSGDLAPVSVGSKAPAFQAVDLATGDTLGLEDYAGDVVLLNIWATWCGPCEQEMPSMQRLHQELAPEGLKIVAVSIDHDDPAAVRRWLADRNLTFQVLQDAQGGIQRVYQTTGVPESFVIDSRGIIVKKTFATEWDHPTQKALFRRLLADRREGQGGG